MTRRWKIFSGLALLALGLLLYAHALHYEFVELDDPLLILENPAAQSFSWEHTKAVFSTYDPELYIPLTFVSYQLDATLGGLDPFVFHLHNLLEHILNAWLLLLLAYGLTRRKWVALFASLLFLVHPINVEAVLWASGRKDLLSATFFLLSLLLYLWHLRKNDWKSYSGSLVSFLLGLLSKVTVISLPVVLLLIDWIEDRKITRKTLLEKVPYLFLALVFGLVALFGKINAPHLSLPTRVLVSAKSLAFAVWKIFLPLQLSPVYGDSAPISLTSLSFLLPLLVVIALGIVTFLMRTRWKVFACGVLFIAVTFAPSFANLVKNGEYYVTSDRYAYIPAMAVFLLVALGLGKIATILETWTTRITVQRSVTALSVALLIILSIMTLTQSTVWRDTETLSRYVTQVSPTASIGHLWYGNALRDRGEIPTALVEYGLALSLKDDAQIYYNRALAYEVIGKTDDALLDYQKAISLDPFYPLAHINLGRLYYQAGMKTEAKAEFTAANKEAPELAMPLYNLGVLEGDQKHFEKAIEFYHAALVRDPTLSDAHANLAIALLNLGRTAEAVDELKATLAQDPENPTARAALERLIKDGIVK